MPKFVPRVKKQKARKRLKKQQDAISDGVDFNTNAEEIVPESKSERDDRRQRLKETLLAAQPASKASSKKKKRLDKYIDTKLKKDERLDLIKKLEQQSANTDLLKSSKTLGRGGVTKREALQQAFREREAGIDTAKNEDIIFGRREVESDDDDESDSNQSLDSPPEVSQNHGVSVTARPKSQPAQSSVASSAGFGLKRPLELDDSGLPVIAKRARKKGPTIKKSWHPPADENEPVWEGFGSDDEVDVAHGSGAGAVEVEESGKSIDPTTHDLLAQLLNEDSSSEDSGGSDNDDSEDVQEDDDEDDEAEEGNEDEDQGSNIEEDKEQQKERSSAFKAWATQMRNDSVGFTPSVNTMDLENRQKCGNTTLMTKKLRNEPLAKPMGEADEDLDSKSLDVKPTSRQIYNVRIERDEEIQEARMKLPVVAEEQKIMEAVFNNNCTIIHGATGSGKTTQIPQFLFEAGFGSPDSSTPGMIGVTQPRRVAAVSMAKRVATELGEHGNRVSYQVRFDSTVDTKTAIKFMTDGVLLREISQDFTLSKYSVLVIDEAHERSVNTDLLIGMLTRVVETRSTLSISHPKKCKPLKLIIMSATLRLTGFVGNESLFRNGSPPVVQAEGRQHPVTIHWSKRTSREYLDDTFNKLRTGHKKLPPGGFLVFLTGQNEIKQLEQRLLDTFASTSEHLDGKSSLKVSTAQVAFEDEDMPSTSRNEALEDDGIDDEEEDEARIVGLDNDEENEFDLGDAPLESLKVHVLPLYSQLPTEHQLRVFKPPPDGSRLIVLATNVAETSLTIPGIRYVFDTGRAKERQYDRSTGVQTFDVNWISKASAQQRAGRAGRTGPGHCYRLYSSAVYENHFSEFAVPEILRTPIDGVVLQLKSMGIPKVSSFPFPTSPDRTSLLQAERLLTYLGAITNNKITSTGRELSNYPLSPRLARILLLAHHSNCLDQALSLISVLAVSDLFITESQLDLSDPSADRADDGLWTEADNREATYREQKRLDYNTFHAHCARLDRQSDVIKMLTALCDFTSDVTSQTFRQFARVKAFQEANQLRAQLAGIANTIHPGSVSITSRAVPTPSASQIKTLRHVVAAGYIDQVAIRVDASPTASDIVSAKPKRAVDVPYLTLFSSSSPEYRKTSESLEQKSQLDQARFVYVHASSILAHTTSPQKMPTYLVYSHLSRSAPSHISGTKVMRTRMHPLAPLTSGQLADLAAGTPLLEEGKPVGRIDSLPRDEQGRERRTFWSTPFLIPGDKGGMGWPLPPARKVVQNRVPGKGWVTESVSK